MDLVATWLMNSVSKKIGHSLLFISTAEGIWNNEGIWFKQDDAPRVYDIEQRLSKIEQGSMDVSTYYTELVTLWEEHRNYVELPVCTCGKYECDAAVLWEKLQHRICVTKFLMGLNESFEHTRRYILMLKPIPTIEEAFNIVTQDERQKLIKPSSVIVRVAFQTTTPMPQDVGYNQLMNNEAYIAAYNPLNANQKPVCTHCGKFGHTIQKCFKLHGFPLGYRTNFSYKPRTRQSSSQPKMQLPSPTNPTAAQTANAIANVYADATTSQMVSGVASDVPSVTSGGKTLTLQNFTPQQIQHLISKFNSHVRVLEHSTLFSPASTSASITKDGYMAPQSTYGNLSFPSTTLTYTDHTLKFKNHCLSVLPSFLSPGDWIVDSGTSSHVCSDLALFSEMNHVSSVTITLPNDTQVPILHT